MVRARLFSERCILKYMQYYIIIRYLNQTNNVTYTLNVCHTKYTYYLFDSIKFTNFVMWRYTIKYDLDIHVNMTLIKGLTAKL